MIVNQLMLNMKNYSTLFVLVLLSTFTYAQTDVSGGIFSPTVWTLAGSPYTVTSDVVIFPDQSLTIEAGVIIQFSPGTQLENRDGDLVAEGTSMAPITFTATNPSLGWNGIVNNNIEPDELVFSLAHAIIEYAETGIDCGAENTYTSMNHITFRYNERGIYDGGLGYHWIQLYDCQFLDNGVGMEGRMSVWNSTFQGNDTGFGNPMSFSNSSEGGRVIDCTFQGNGIGVGTIGQIITFAVIDNCLFDGNDKAVYNYWAEISNTSIENSSELGVFLQKGSIENSAIRNNNVGIEVSQFSSSLEIQNNQIILNDYGVKVNGPGALISDNSICGNTLYNAISTSDEAIDLSQNCWCTDDLTNIGNGIFDAYEDVSLGIATFDPISISCLDPVYPGDANRDGMVNGKDMVFLGLGMGQSGATRENASSNWSAQYAEDWNTSFSNGINAKYADLNGDGTIDVSDRDVLDQNYGLSHDFGVQSELPSSNQTAELYFELQSFENSELNLRLVSSGDMSQMSGISFRLSMDMAGLDTDLIEYDFNDSWWPNDNLMEMMKMDENGIDFSFYRSSNMDWNSTSTLLNLRIMLAENSNDIEIQFEDILVVTQDGYTIETSGIEYVETLSSTTHIEANGFNLYPNPSHHQLSFEIQDDFEAQDIKLMDLSGQLLESIPYEKSMDIRHLPNGSYLIQIVGSKGIRTSKFVKI